MYSVGIKNRDRIKMNESIQILNRHTTDFLIWSVTFMSFHINDKEDCSGQVENYSKQKNPSQIVGETVH